MSICLGPLQSAGQIDALVPDSLWRRRPVSEGAVWSDGVAMVAPLADEPRTGKIREAVKQAALTSCDKPCQLTIPMGARIVAQTKAEWLEVPFLRLVI